MWTEETSYTCGIETSYTCAIHIAHAYKAYMAQTRRRQLAYCVGGRCLRELPPSAAHLGVVPGLRGGGGGGASHQMSS